MPEQSHALTLLIGDAPPRADATRNLAKLLATTKEFVLAGNLNPSAAQIAEAAGVGVGTLYRRALGKEALLAAAVIDLLDEVCQNADNPTTTRTWQGFEEFALRYLTIREVTCSITHALDDEFDGGVAASKQRTRVAFENLTRRLHDAHLLAPDIDAADLMVTLASIDITDETLGLASDPTRRQRVALRMLNCLRAPTAR